MDVEHRAKYSLLQAAASLTGHLAHTSTTQIVAGSLHQQQLALLRSHSRQSTLSQATTSYGCTRAETSIASLRLEPCLHSYMALNLAAIPPQVDMCS